MPWGLTVFSLSSSGYLVLDKPLDRESLDYYTLVVTASDGQPDGVRNSDVQIYSIKWLSLLELFHIPSGIDLSGCREGTEIPQLWY